MENHINCNSSHPGYVSEKERCPDYGYCNLDGILEKCNVGFEIYADKCVTDKKY